jgi:hypothetical protein
VPLTVSLMTCCKQSCCRTPVPCSLLPQQQS